MEEVGEKREVVCVCREGGGGARLYQGATGVAARETPLKHIDYTTKW